MTTVGWIDIFSRKRYRDIIVDSLRFCQEKKGLKLFGYVIMSNHVHAIVRTEGIELSNVLRDFKTFTAHEILKSIQAEPESRREWLLYMFHYFAGGDHARNKHYQFWQSDNHPIELWSLPVIWQKLNYIHDNPVRAGIVEHSYDYLYSSSRNYRLGSGLLDVVLIEGPD